jgi:hypothetical protein
MQKVRGLLRMMGTALWCWAGVLCAQQMGEGEKFELRGRVVNAVTGEPVAGALVETFAGGKRAQFTAPDGMFAFVDLAPGNYPVEARKPGYFNDRDLGIANPGDLTRMIPSEQDALIKLTPEGVIYGRVEDEKGQAIEGLLVQAEMWTVANGTRQLQSLGGMQAETNDEGSFRIAELPPGDYYVKFSERGGRMIFRNNQRRGHRKGTGAAHDGQQGYGSQF